MIKLGKLRVENFKSFKEAYEVDLSDKGLLILDGPNGFGKTTLFDAIELCFTGKVGRISNTDNKQKNTHVLKNDESKITDLFLELKDGNNTSIVIYAYIPPYTSKEENKPSNCSVVIKLLNTWPNNFSEISEDLINRDISLDSIIGNENIGSTFDIFNYIQQEETCHFLKDKESKRHEKISHLFGTVKQTRERKNIKDIKTKLATKASTIFSKISLLEEEKRKIEINLESVIEDGNYNKDSINSSKVQKIIESPPENKQQLMYCMKYIDDLIWFMNNREEFKRLEYNYYINYILDNRKNELKDLILIGHFSSFEQINKLQKHFNWLLSLNKKIDDHNHIISLCSEESDSLSMEVISFLKKNSTSLDAGLLEKVILCDSLYLEIGTYQEILSKITNSRDELRKQFELCLDGQVDENVKCPFCGDKKALINDLWVEYDNQSIIFEKLKSEKLSDFEKIRNEIKLIFIAKFTFKSRRFIEKYQRYLKLQGPISEQLVSFDRWNSVMKIKNWLNSNNISIDELLRDNNYEYIGDSLLERESLLKSKLRSEILFVDTDISFNMIKTSLKSLDVKILNLKLINSDNIEIYIEDLEKDKNYLRLIDVKMNSFDLEEKKKEIEKLNNIYIKVKSKETLVNSIYLKYNSKIKEYEKSVAKQIAIPFYIYSSKILQTRPDGNGAFLRSAENIKENGYIRFVSNLKDDHDAWNTMSSGQLSGLVISFMLAMNKVYPTKLSTLLIDDPIQTMDEINLASFVQLLRNEFPEKQIMISTHERKSANYFAYKYQKQTNVSIINMKQQRLGSL
ncbi:AAA family ATPase [Photobacterium phosphoreum]|uniref:AAA family ATPase n=1 Tax=Photobacterium phosphoreum TaxID=659 RepID=A0AAW4ZXZ0_PHOPO|nr:AAA family ATPase [Photobacterium phosphoreum]MCD9493087.1 AAA family ATPase [Photobacterium phosphoreum]MCF2192375.1 AAA family ATPase [Photobacterium phosphoreum]MCF2304017.1 AAA family ATPase [Photobacterium phosphoreum]